MQHVHEPVSCEEDDVRQTRHEGRRHPLCPLAACVFGACLPLAALLASSSTHAPELESAAVTSAGVKTIPPLTVSRPHVRSLLTADWLGVRELVCQQGDEQCGEKFGLTHRAPLCWADSGDEYLDSLVPLPY